MRAKSSGPSGEYRLRSPQLGQAGIRLGHDRAGAHAQQFGNHRLHLFRPEAAVGSHHIHAHVLHGFGKYGGGRSRKAYALLKSHRNHYRQVTDLSGGHHGGPGLGQVKLGFDENKISPAGHKPSYLLGENFNKLGRFNRTQRFGEMSGGSHVARHENRAAVRA